MRRINERTGRVLLACLLSSIMPLSAADNQTPQPTEIEQLKQMLADQQKQEPAQPEHHAGKVETTHAKPAATKNSGAKPAALKEPADAKLGSNSKTGSKSVGRKTETRQAVFDRHSIAKAEVKPVAVKPAKKSVHRRKSKTDSQSDSRS